MFFIKLKISDNVKIATDIKKSIIISMVVGFFKLIILYNFNRKRQQKKLS